ncbi:MAG: hypothetical protein A2622_02755 [Bdellovibrionales bacterium RIFCSPHIGHO2_01_FULL_40_29]|nr:MAG: hypothetical protein A2622_02755 [Bdellovibrionales bacterium RIFCSPHIGHO2_01_FULL_40_29]OFZ33998.1 MAG: hypothetical protein A3D17_03175 [Bdellovibrionales bacterium RIFCSPHIGHO2_02_FULL_40_15]
MSKILMVLLLATIGCANLPSRKVASQQPAEVTFYHADSCKINGCTETLFSLTTPEDQQVFADNLKSLIEKSKIAKSELKKSKNMDDLIKFHLGNSSLAEGSKFALDLLEKHGAQSATQINEVFWSIKNNFRPPLETDVQLFHAPLFFLKLVAYNSVTPIWSTADKLKDPQASTFWQPQNIQTADTHKGFDRENANHLSGQECQYDKAKAGYGVHPGFHIRCGEKKFKLKLGAEVHSSAFNSRIYWALGYNVPLIDFIERPIIGYNRRLLTEFNSRRIENFRLKLGSETLYKINNEHYYSPFEYISEVILKDGTLLTSDEFKIKLFKNAQLEKPELVSENFNENFENEIASIRMLPSSYIEKTKDDEIGPWRYDQLKHAERRELRGLQLLAAWVGNFDMRMDNTRLIRQAKTNELKHLFSDVGSGLGSSNFLMTKGSTRIDKMNWTVTRTIPATENSTDERVEINGLMSIENNKAFRSMTFEDGQWMVTKICQFSDDQLKSSLIAAGLTGAEARLAYEKLLFRRNQMVTDFRLETELKSCFREANAKLNYNEKNDGPFQAITISGETVQARSSDHLFIKKGKLFPRQP